MVGWRALSTTAGIADQQRVASEGADSAVLRAVDVSVRFGGVHALQSVTFAPRKGEVTGLIGPNGAGKTTLFDVISGLCTPTTGTIHYGGRDITSQSAVWRARHGLRRTFQRQQVFGQLTVEENVLAGYEWHGGGGGLFADVLRLPGRTRLEHRRRERAMATLEMCGLLAVRAKPADQLPIGLARMVELARAVVDEPTLLLLDEPTSGLDAQEMRNLSEVLEAVRQSGCSIILVEHDMSFVMTVSDRIFVLELGRVIAEETPATLHASEIVRYAYLN
jgi:branched-chain amino acid transport system ATP-binding protein